MENKVMEENKKIMAYENQEENEDLVFDEEYYDSVLQQEEENAIKDLFVVRRCGYNYDVHISTSDDEINEEEFKRLQAENPDFNRLPPVVGYWIINKSEQPIKDIIVPHYELNKKDNKYYAIEEKVTLNEDETLWLPTKYFVMLMMRPEYNGKCGNGRLDFSKYSKIALEKKDYDAVLNSIPFKSEGYWAEMFKADGGIFPIAVGTFTTENDTEPEKEEVTDEDNGVFIKRFGYLNNGIMKATGKVENNKQDTNSAKLLAGIINLGK